MQTLPLKYRLSKACWIYNRSTSPHKLRTDEGHRAARKCARKVLQWLRTNAPGLYRESNSGMLWPVDSMRI
jgi:hypothetical protein